MSSVTLGILGYGITGRSVIRLCLMHPEKVLALCNARVPVLAQSLTITVWEAKTVAPEHHAYLAEHGIVVHNAATMSLDTFINVCDVVMPSQGFDMRSYAQYSHRFIEELDFFTHFYHGSSVGITGSLGKTSVTKLITQLLQMSSENGLVDGYYVAAGNIGAALCDAVIDQPEETQFVLELSSTQLERNTTYVPTVAVLTNLYPNHLDRHVSMEEYIAAKAHLFQTQDSKGILIVHEQCVRLASFRPYLERYQGRCIVITTQETYTILPMIERSLELFFVDAGNQLVIVQYDAMHYGKPFVIATNCIVATLPPVTFYDNWLIALAAVYAVGVSITKLLNIIAGVDTFVLTDNRYRIEHFLTANGISFYDDSKSTVMQATLAAAQKLALEGRPLIVILGGKGKGVDRSSLMSELAKISMIKKVLSFGPESMIFVDSQSFTTLEDLVNDLPTIATSGDIVLFSPSGASFDFFANYQHRGDVFKELIRSRFCKGANQ